MSDVWSHIFDLHLPDMTPGNLHITLPHCDNATSNAAQERAQRICVNNTTLFLELHKQHVEMVNEILETLQHVYHLLPAEKNIYRPTMAKRSLLPIGGYILSGLFGTTSEADLAPINKHMRSIAQGVTHLDRGLQVQSDRLASFIEMSAVRMDLFRNLTIMQETAITELYDKLGVMFNTQTQNVQRIVMTLRRIQRYITHLRHIDQLRQGIEFLLHGILSPQLVPKSTLPKFGGQLDHIWNVIIQTFLLFTRGPALLYLA